jgi:putative transposase
MNFSRGRLPACGVIPARAPVIDEILAERIQRLIGLHPTFGYRRLWALLRFGQGIHINRKAVYRVLKVKGWLVNQRAIRPRPRSRIEEPGATQR